MFIFGSVLLRWWDGPECCPHCPHCPDSDKLGVKSSDRIFSFSEMPKHKSSNVSINALTNNYTGARSSRHIVTHNNSLADSDHSTESRGRGSGRREEWTFRVRARGAREEQASDGERAWLFAVVTLCERSQTKSFWWFCRRMFFSLQLSSLLMKFMNEEKFSIRSDGEIIQALLEMC